MRFTFITHVRFSSGSPSHVHELMSHIVLRGGCLLSGALYGLQESTENEFGLSLDFFFFALRPWLL